MRSRSVSGITLTLLLISMVTLAFNIHYSKAEWTWTETIYIKADGSVDPEIAPILSVDNITYVFTDDIYDSIVVERDNIVVDGAGYTVQGTGAYGSKGIDLAGRENVTVQNTQIKNFDYGIWLHDSTNNSISGNIITANNWIGIVIYSSSDYNSISGNTLANNYDSIWLEDSTNNSISGNIITANNWIGIVIYSSSNYNSISGNTLANNYHGIVIDYCAFRARSSNNIIYLNNFIDNGEQVDNYDSMNVWDDGCPSGGNYWSDYTTRYPDAQELDDSGIWDTPYDIDEDNQDNYPLMEPWTPSPPLPTTIPELKTEIERCWSEGEIDNQGIANSLVRKLNVAQKLVGKGKIAEAKSILEDDFIPQVQNLSGICIAVDAADIFIQSAEYILSNL